MCFICGDFNKKNVNKFLFDGMNTTSTVFHCRKEIVAGSKVLAKKFNDIWYSGVVTDVQKPENTENPSQVGGK